LEGAVKIKGDVQAILVFGKGPNSAELQVRVRSGHQTNALRAGAYPATEPSVFAAMATIVTSAYLNYLPVEFEVTPAPKGTPQIVRASLGS
jgi:hypothetical protein